MFIELTKLYPNEDGSHWNKVPVIVQTESIAGFYTHPEYGGPCVVMLSGTDPILVDETYKKLYKTVHDTEKKSEFEWVPCDEYLPIEDGDYLVTTNRLSYSVDFETFSNGHWKSNGSRILAWMPIPKPYWLGIR